jgi:Transcriptional regulatory protein, C terminal
MDRRSKVFHLLAYLLAQRDRTVPRLELCEHLWPKQFITDATLDACLAQARQAVGDSGRPQRVVELAAPGRGGADTVVALLGKQVAVCRTSSQTERGQSRIVRPYR